jgi:hypothetical protein
MCRERPDLGLGFLIRVELQHANPDPKYKE